MEIIVNHPEQPGRSKLWNNHAVPRLGDFLDLGFEYDGLQVQAVIWTHGDNVTIVTQRRGDGLKSGEDLIEGSEPSTLYFDRDHPFALFHFRLISGLCIKCGTNLPSEQTQPWCGNCIKPLQDKRLVPQEDRTYYGF